MRDIELFYGNYTSTSVVPIVAYDIAEALGWGDPTETADGGEYIIQKPETNFFFSVSQSFANSRLTISITIGRTSGDTVYKLPVHSVTDRYLLVKILIADGTIVIGTAANSGGTVNLSPKTQFLMLENENGDTSGIYLFNSSSQVQTMSNTTFGRMDLSGFSPANHSGIYTTVARLPDFLYGQKMFKNLYFFPTSNMQLSENLIFEADDGRKFRTILSGRFAVLVQ